MPETMMVWGLGLIAIAFVLLVIDIFVPTFGILSLTSLACSVAGVYCLFQVGLLWGVIGSGIVVVGGPSVFFFGLQIMPSTPLGRKLVLGADDPQEGEGAPRRPVDETERHLIGLIGAEAVVLTDLRPVGTVRINDRRYEAMSQTTLVRAGETVRVISTEAGTLRVRPV